MYAIRFLTLDWAFFTQNSCKVPFRIPETLLPPALLEDNLCGFKDKSVCRWAFALISMPWKMYGGVHKKACIKENPLENYTHNWQWISNVNDSRSVETIPQDDQHPSQIWNKSLDGLLTRKQIFAATKEMSTCSYRPSFHTHLFSALPPFQLANTSACKAVGKLRRTFPRKTGSRLLVKTALACRQQSPLNPNSVKIVSAGKWGAAFPSTTLTFPAIRMAMSTSWRVCVCS